MTREGTVLDGKYEIWKEVGRGGMSIVYLARDKHLNKQWAVKEIKNDGTKSTKTLLKGLEREANILKNVDHPVLPRIVDIIDQEGTIYVVMDFIEGTTISDRLKEDGAQPQDLVVEWGLQLASALDYLHNMKPPVIYRDMKPSNVMIRPEGGVKLIDFGTAKEYEIENNADTTALGTRGYAAPEQFGDSKGRGIYNTDARTDIYNLGATLYHVVTGMNPCEPPYEIKPIREWNPALSSGLEKIILKCTQADPNDRYQNCKELIYALEHYNELDDEHRKKNKRKVAAFATTAVLAVAAGVTSFIGYRGLQKIRMNDYNTYVEEGNSYRIENDYAKAAEEYKKAFELDGTDAEAYRHYIDVHIEASRMVMENGEKPPIDLASGLNVVANRVKAGYDNVDKNDEVLFALGSAYFNELADYKTAAKYFKMVNEKDAEYGSVAKHYLAVATVLSDSTVRAESLLEEVNSFADEALSNKNDDKRFDYYRSIGNIYATYINTLGVAEKAVDFLEAAKADLESTDKTDEEKNYYLYSYLDNLITAYAQLAKNDKDSKTNYEFACEYIDDFLVILEIKAEQEGVEIGGSSSNAYNTGYANKMSAQASYRIAIDLLEDKGKVVNSEITDIFREACDRMGKNNDMSAKLYSEYLGYLYDVMMNNQSDVEKWSNNKTGVFDALSEVYEESKGVKGIESNTNWKKMATKIDTANKAVSESKEDSTTEAEQPADAEDGTGE